MEKHTVVGLALTASMIVAEHLADQLLRWPRDDWRWIIARYVMGCVAILAGLFAALPWQQWLLVVLFTATAGAATIGALLVVSGWRWYQRAKAAEEHIDG